MRSYQVACQVGCALAFSLATPLAAQRVDHDALEQAIGEPVTTSVTGKPQRQSETPASTIIITHDQIARSPARDVPGLLKGYAGIDVNHWTAGQSDVAVRGGVQTFSPRLLVLVNGRQVYLDHYGVTDWNLLGIQLEEIQQIELVRGPAGALFGFNAASAVVNIITVDPLDREQATLAVESGDHGYRRAAASIAVPIGTSIGLRLSGGHMREDERAIPANIRPPVRADAVLRNDVSAAIDANLGSRTRVTLTGGYSGNRQLELELSQITNEQRYRTETAGMRIDHDTAWGSLTANVYSNWLQVQHGIGTDDPNAGVVSVLPVFDLSTRTVVANASSLFRLGSENTGRVGIEYRDNMLDSSVAISRSIGYSVTSANAMLDLHPHDRIGVTLAARLDRLALRQSGAIVQPINVPSDYDRDLTTASFNAALQWRIGDKGSLRLNGGRAVQAPSLAVFGAAIPVPIVGLPIPGVIAGDPAIHPVAVSSAEIGYAHRASSALQFDATAFYTRTDRAIAFPGNTPSIELRTAPTLLAVIRFRNIGDFETYGVELSASGALLRHLSWRANYTLTETREQLPGDPSQVTTSFSPGVATPRHKINLAVDYARDRWSLSALGRYTSATRQIALRPDAVFQLYDVRRAFAIDARIAYRLGKRLTLSLAGENLTKASGATLSPIPADRRLRAGVAFAR